MANIYVRKVQVQGNQLVVNIPFDVRRRLGIGKGDHVYYEIDGDRVALGHYDPVHREAEGVKDAISED